MTFAVWEKGKMMSDYIKREDAIEAFDPRQRRDWYTPWIVETLKDLPSADVAPVRHGHWIIECVREYELSYGGTAYVPEYECSCCGFTTESYVRLDEPIMPEDADFPKYCPNCGAKMDEVDTND